MGDCISNILASPQRGTLRAVEYPLRCLRLGTIPVHVYFGVGFSVDIARACVCVMLKQMRVLLLSSLTLAQEPIRLGFRGRKPGRASTSDPSVGGSEDAADNDDVVGMNGESSDKSYVGLHSVASEPVYPGSLRALWYCLSWLTTLALVRSVKP